MGEPSREGQVRRIPVHPNTKQPLKPLTCLVRAAPTCSAPRNRGLLTMIEKERQAAMKDGERQAAEAPVIVQHNGEAGEHSVSDGSYGFLGISRHMRI